LPLLTAPVARVYKRWIFVSITLTLLFSWFFFPYWFDTRIVPEKLGKISEFLFESALFRMLPNGFPDGFLGNVTSILQPFWNSEFEALESPGRILRVQGAKAKFPVILIPGITSTGLELWEGKECAQSYFRQRLWGTLTMMRFMVIDSSCWLEHLKLDSRTGNDPDGIKIRSAQGLEAADFILPGFWVWARIIENLAEIGYDHNNLVMAPYDWRLDFERMESRDHYFSRLKSQIELLTKTRGEKVVALSHSLGGLVWFHFMKWVESDVGGKGGAGWVEKHVHATASIGSPYLGLPKSLAMLISGEMRDTAQMGRLESFLLEMLMSKKERLSLFRTWCGGFSMLPKGGNIFWGNGTAESLVDAPPDHTYGIVNMSEEDARTTGMRTGYLMDDIDDLLNSFVPSGIVKRNSIAHSDNKIGMPKEVPANDNNPHTWSNVLQSRLPNAPSLRIYCMYGFGKDTERAYEYEAFPRENWPEALRNATFEELREQFRTDNVEDIVLRIRLKLEAENPSKRLYKGIYHVDGDGTVPTLSNGYMCAYGWKKLRHLNPANLTVIPREYPDEPLTGLGTIRGGPRTSDHVDILGNHEMTMDILKIVSDFREPGDDDPVPERILSNIESMARKIKLPF
jgi:phospholipid:diacylglycerol acyltransferase